MKILNGDEIEKEYGGFSFEDDDEYRKKEYVIDAKNKIIYELCGKNIDPIFITVIYDPHDSHHSWKGIRIDETHYLYGIFR